MIMQYIVFPESCVQSIAKVRFLWSFNFSFLLPVFGYSLILASPEFRRQPLAQTVY